MLRQSDGEVLGNPRMHLPPGQPLKLGSAQAELGQEIRVIFCAPKRLPLDQKNPPI
jgi:hypothetical protein